MTEPERPDDSLSDVFASLQKEIAQEDRGLHGIRSWSTPVRYATAMAVMLVVTLGVLGATPRLDMDAYPRLRLLGSAALLVAVVSFGVRRFLWPQTQRAQREWVMVAGGAALLLIPFVMAVLPAPHHELHLHPESFEGTGADFVPRAVACLIFGLLVGVPTMVVMLFVNRRASLSSSRVALAASVGGVAGTLGLLLHCPLVGIAHRLAGHGTVGIATTAVLVGSLALFSRLRESRESA